MGFIDCLRLSVGKWVEFFRETCGSLGKLAFEITSRRDCFSFLCFHVGIITHY